MASCPERLCKVGCVAIGTCRYWAHELTAVPLARWNGQWAEPGSYLPQSAKRLRLRKRLKKINKYNNVMNSATWQATVDVKLMKIAVQCVRTITIKVIGLISPTCGLV